MGEGGGRGITFLKNPANSKTTMCTVKISWENRGQENKKTQET
jgi:hypothetical protein